MTGLTRRTVGSVNRVGAVVLMAVIRTYQAVVSPWVTQQCKYYPSCSAYGLEAVRVHGAIRGARLATWRVLRCNPWSDGGVDHVPPIGEIAAPEAVCAEAVCADAPYDVAMEPSPYGPSDLART